MKNYRNNILNILITLGVLAGIFSLFNYQSSKFERQFCTEVNCILLEVADSPQERATGLSFRETMRPNHGMLFVFSEPDRACMWMKDMNFPLDIVWLDSDKEIIKISQNISPDTFPEAFCGDQLTKYVIELNAGVTQLLKLKAGHQITIN